MKKITIHDKAVRLVEGGIIEIEGLNFKLRKFPDWYDDDQCMECELDSICRMEHTDICWECEAILRKRCCLQLAVGNPECR